MQADVQIVVNRGKPCIHVSGSALRLSNNGTQLYAVLNEIVEHLQPNIHARTRLMHMALL